MVEEQSAAGLCGEDGGELLERGVEERGLLRDACGVEDGERRAVAVEGIEQGGESGAVGEVERGEGDASAEARELIAQRVSARSERAAAAEQDEVLSAASSEPETELRADAAGSAGDEDGAGGSEGERGDRSRQRRADEASSEKAGGAKSELVFLGGSGEQSE